MLNDVIGVISKYSAVVMDDLKISKLDRFRFFKNRHFYFRSEFLLYRLRHL